MQADCTATAERPATARSAVANGSRLFVEGLDGRSALARRYRDLVAQFHADVGGDPSEAQQQVIRRAASLSVWCEAVEVRLANGEDIDIGPYTTACNAVRRLLLDIGLQRTAKDITPNLREYLASLGPEPGAGESFQSGGPAEPAAGEATGEAANESEPHTECAGLNGHPAQPAGAAPHDAVAHSADCASVPASSADGGEHG